MIGQVIGGKYQIESLLGEGAMGRVYAAQHQTLARKVAVKILRTEVASFDWASKRFRAEAQAASRLDHPNCVQVLDFGDEKGTLFLVMEILQGQSLRDLLKRIGAMSELRSCRIMSQVLSVLGAAHQNGVIHRDLKPANIMLIKKADLAAGEDFIKVCDFGIAKIHDVSDPDDPTALQTLTKMGQPIGTPAFMSPEQAAGLKVDARCDLYAAGVTLYRMITGVHAFQSESVQGVLNQVMLGEFKRPSQVLSTLNPHIEQIILTAMRKQPSERFGSAREMKAALDAVLEGQAPAVRMTMPSLPINKQAEETVAAHRSVASTIAGGTRPHSGAPFQSVTGSSWSVASIRPEPKKSPVKWIAAALVVAIAGATAIGLRGKTSEASASRLSEIINEGAYGAAESYALKHVAVFQSDPNAIEMVHGTMRQRRETEDFERTLEVSYDPSYTLTGKTAWAGSINEGGKPQVIEIEIEPAGSSVVGVIDYPDLGLRASLAGYVDGNHILLWDHRLDIMPEDSKIKYQLYDKYHAFISGDRLRGIVGPERQRMELTLKVRE
jgi:serine/threonine protein kinase